MLSEWAKRSDTVTVEAGKAVGLYSECRYTHSVMGN